MSRLSEAVWGEILVYVRNHFPGVGRGWFAQLEPGALRSGRLVVYTADEAQLTYMRKHCVQAFVEGSQAATGRLISVEFAARTTGPTQGQTWPDAHPMSDLAFERDTGLLRLNPDYIFDNFVTGACNRLAHASCVAVSQALGTAYNPLFIHGSVGLGKTHLGQAVCQEVLENSPATQLMYLSCETFVNHFIEAIEKGALDSFRYRYRHVDLLVIDDIQFLAKRERTQEEFFHTFNTLYQMQKQIILLADSPPSEIPSLEERLVSRFNWGLVARIDAPGLETRMAIIQKKMRLRGMALPEDVVLHIASRAKSNTRELEGVLTRLRGLAALEGAAPIDLALAREALGEAEAVATQTIQVQDIMSAVTERFGVRLSDLQGRRRSRSIALPRQVCMYLARQLTEHSLGEIGGFFGGRDHTTVLHAHRLIGQRRNTDVAFCSRLEEIEGSLRRN
ncbi:MAG: chromosomal replication initiator protein DnaA [Planctomycetota bacterium]